MQKMHLRWTFRLRSRIFERFNQRARREVPPGQHDDGNKIPGTQEHIYVGQLLLIILKNNSTQHKLKK